MWNDEHYLHWLCEHIDNDTLPSTEDRYSLLAEQMHNTEFSWVIDKDENRAETGKYFRVIYANEFGIGINDIPDYPCSFLEMILGLCQEAAYLSDLEYKNSISTWFMVLIDNIGLIGFDDDRYTTDNMSSDIVDDILEDVMNRKYNSNGVGGFFPMPGTDEDQPEVELWYQLNEYIMYIEDSYE